MSIPWNSNNPLIDPRICVLIKGRQPLKSNTSRSNYFRDDFVYDWEAVQSLFGPNLFREDTYPELTYETCLEYVEIVRPLWEQTTCVCQRLLEKNKLLLYENLQWFGNANILKKFLDSPKSPTYVVEGCLLFTSALENSLGNIYYTITRKSPPHLLKDLISANEINNCFSSFPIFFLKLLLGTPNSVNLRNIVWHGFPAPEDIPEYYLSVLIVLINTLSVLVKQQSFSVIYRDKVNLRPTDFDDEILKLCCLEDDSTVCKVLHESKYVLKSHSIYWEHIYTYFRNENFEQFIILILPQIELVLRLIYAECNIVDVGAKLDEYYIIIDTIFERRVINKQNTENKIFSHLDHGTLKLLYDLFISQNGPSVRDKISHGEVNFDTLDRSICSVLLLLSLNLLEGPNNKVYSLSSYESKFHMNVVVFRKISLLSKCVQRLRDIKIPSELKHLADWNEAPTVAFNAQYSGNIKIFIRPKQENELVAILSKVMDCIELSCDNLLCSFQNYFELYNKKQLRSPRRKTLEKMLTSLPVLHNTLEVMIREVGDIFGALQQREDDLSDVFYRKCVKFLKSFLKYTENMAKYCQCNEWANSMTICNIFLETLEDFRK